MSRNDWESGTLIIPRDQYARSRVNIISKYNDHQHTLFTLAANLADTLNATLKGKRGSARHAAAVEAIVHFRRTHDPIDGYRVERVVWRDGKVHNPKKKDFPHLPLTKSASIDHGGLTVTLNNDQHTLTWTVDEGNHAVEDARSSWLGKAVLRELNHNIEWKRGSGGVFVGNDEYNRDSDEPGGGANYVTASYGPLGKKDRGY